MCLASYKITQVPVPPIMSSKELGKRPGPRNIRFIRGLSRCTRHVFDLLGHNHYDLVASCRSAITIETVWLFHSQLRRIQSYVTAQPGSEILDRVTCNAKDSHTIPRYMRGCDGHLRNFLVSVAVL